MLALLATQYVCLLGVVRKVDGIIERREREAQARHTAYHDVLTGLPNHMCFGSVSGCRCPCASPWPSVRAALRGPRPLQARERQPRSSGRRRAAARGGVPHPRLPARQRPPLPHGRGEFTAILPRIVSNEDAALVAAVSQPVRVHGQEVNVGASVAIVVCPTHGTTAETLVRNADAAMYGAKSAGRGQHVSFSEPAS